MKTAELLCRSVYGIVLSCCLLFTFVSLQGEPITEPKEISETGQRYLETTAESSGVVSWVRTENPPTPSGRVAFGFNTTTNEVQLYLPPKWGPFGSIEMTDERGQRLRKTELGSKLISLSRTNTFDRSHFQRHYGWKRLWPYMAHPMGEGATALSFPSPEQLFRIERPGAYKITMEIQVLTPAKGRLGPLRVISFPAMVIPIEIPATAIRK